MAELLASLPRCQSSPPWRLHVIQSEVVQTEPHKLLAIVSWVIAAGCVGGEGVESGVNRRRDFASKNDQEIKPAASSTLDALISMRLP